MNTTITSRRRAIAGFSVASIFAGFSVPALASVLASNPDAELIALCNQLTALVTKRNAINEAAVTWEQEQEVELEIAQLYADQDPLMDQISSLPGPQTMPGLRAMAAAALIMTSRDSDGEVMVDNDPDHLAWTILEAIAGMEVSA